MSLSRLDLMKLCHEQAHSVEHNFEDAVLMALTRREIWLTTLSFLILSDAAACLADDCAEVLERLSELLDQQKPHWRGVPPDGSSET